MKKTAARAIRDRRYSAHGGILFLDEVGDIPLSAQASFLRVLEEGGVTRLGEVTLRKVNVRTSSATHYDLQKP